MAITNSVNSKTESYPEPDPIDEVRVASLEILTEPNLEKDAKFFLEEEDEHPMDVKSLDELLDPPKPPIELKPLPTGLRYSFFNNDSESPMIISDKLTQKESLCLMIILEKHRSAFG